VVFMAADYVSPCYGLSPLAEFPARQCGDAFKSFLQNISTRYFVNPPNGRSWKKIKDHRPGTAGVLACPRPEEPTPFWCGWFTWAW